MEKARKHMASTSSFEVILLYLIKVLSSGCKFAHATDTLLPGQSLSGNQTLLSKYGAFELAFNCLYPPCSSDYKFGIWYINTCSPLLVWVPVADISIINPWSSLFSLSEDGNLDLTNDDSLIWSSSDTKSISIHAVAILLDNGNLVVRDQTNSSLVFWQSFDNPIGTLLPGGWLGFNRITGKNISLNSYDSYAASSNFILEINANQRRGFIIRQNSNYPVYPPRKHPPRKYSGTFPSWMGIPEDGDSYLLLNNAHVYVQLDDSGYVHAAKLGDCTSELWSAPYSPCDFDSYCSPNRICIQFNSSCRCYDGSISVCPLNVPLNCQSNVRIKQEVSFHPTDGVYKFPDAPRSMELGDTRECEAVCFSDCSCTSYAFNRTCLCLVWFKGF